MIYLGLYIFTFASVISVDLCFSFVRPKVARKINMFESKEYYYGV